MAERAAGEGVSTAELVRRLIDQALFGTNEDLAEDLAAIDVSFGALREVATANKHVLGAVSNGHHCAGYEYPAVATYEQQFALFWRILPCDHVPGALIVREAGGTVRHLDGSPYRPADSERGLLVAANADVWRTVRDTLFPDPSIL